MRLIQIVPKEHFRLYGAIVAKEVELRRKNQGTFRRSASKQKNYAKWNHKSFYGWLWLHRGLGEVVTVELNSRTGENDEWQLLHAFLGFVDRHFAAKVQSIHIQYE
jgi:hypothetical protein